MASRSSTVIISSSPIAKVGGLLTLTIAEINGTWLPFWLADGPLAPKCDSHPFGDWPPNLVITRGGTGSLLYYTKQPLLREELQMGDLALATIHTHYQAFDLAGQLLGETIPDV